MRDHASGPGADQKGLDEACKERLFLFRRYQAIDKSMPAGIQKRSDVFNKPDDTWERRR